MKTNASVTVGTCSAAEQDFDKLMLADTLIRALVGLLPVIIFLIVLLYMDSYKLVDFWTICVSSSPSRSVALHL